jgi:TRAP-type C4-dicarboxylate transport system substrate-binding protein
MNGKRSLAIAAVIVVSAGLAACGGGAPAQSGTTTKLGGNASTTITATLLTAIGPDLELTFADSVKKLSAGTIAISVTGNWRPDDLSNEADLVKEVASGKAELGYIGARGFDTVGVNSFAGLQAPMLIDSLDLEAKVLATDWAKKLLDGPRSIGIVGLGYVQGELRQPLGITRDLANVSDFQGARIGARPSHVTEMTMKALEATIVATPAASVNLSGLDGMEMGMPGVAGNHYDQGAKSFTGNLVFWARPNVIFANAKWFDALTADQQGLLRAAAAETDQGSVATARQGADGSRGLLCAGGLSITSASQAALVAFRQKLQPVTDEMAKDPATKATIDAILALRGPVDAPDVVAPCPKAAPSASPSTGPTPIDGVWKTSFTKADLIASPLVGSGEINDGNWGDFTFTFESGRVSYTQSNQLGNSSSSGTFGIKGDALTMAFDQGANAGETFGYRWSIFKNTLTFKRDETLGGGPTPFLVKPWTRVR